MSISDAGSLSSNKSSSAANFINWIIFLNIFIYVFQDKFTEYFKIYSLSLHPNVNYMIYSMFYHASWSHLLSNMWGLRQYARALFVDTRFHSRVWNNCYSFLFLYFCSGIVGSCGIYYVGKYFEYIWSSKVQSAQQMVTCSHWLCVHGLNKITRPVASAFVHTVYGTEYAALQIFNHSNRLGASGGVFGLVGARIYTAIFSESHSSMSTLSLVWLIWTLYCEYNSSTLSLKDFWKAITSGDNVDHTLHFISAVCGFILALGFHLLDSYFSRHYQSSPSQKKDD